MNYSNIEKIINIENHFETYLDEDENFQTTNPLDKVNDYLSKGWILLSIDSLPNDDHTSHIHQYILGFPKSTPSE